MKHVIQASIARDPLDGEDIKWLLDYADRGLVARWIVADVARILIRQIEAHRA